MRLRDAITAGRYHARVATLVITSPLAGDGKSTLAAGLADAFARRGYGVDALTIIEHHDPATAAAKGDAVLLVAHGGNADDVTLERAARECSAAAIVFTSVLNGQAMAARDRVAAISARLDVTLLLVGAVPQDRLLAAPSLAQMAAALDGSLEAVDDAAADAVEWIEIGPITAHPGSVHFATDGSKAIVARGDRPDVALTALEVDAQCLILAGGGEPLRYVLERAEVDEVPLIATALTTAEAVERLGSLYGHGSFSGPRKRERAALLVENHLDMEALEQLLQLGRPA